jgi:succinyl-CoA synthetase beta subunit
MDLFEHQGKQHLSRYGVPVPQGVLAGTPDDARSAAAWIGPPVVVKAQVRAGGRGKAGGVKVALTLDEAAEHARSILGMLIGGQQAETVLVEPAADVAHEYYAAFSVDRSARADVAIVSARGGVDIETVAHDDPDAVARAGVDPLAGFDEGQAAQLVSRAGLDGTAAAAIVDVMQKMFVAFAEGDAELVEVNPLAVLAGGDVVALDAKVVLDDNAAFRHPEWAELGSLDTADPRERRAREKGLNYVGLSGSVGIIGNGAGLVMSTLDVVTQVGGSAANFLDVGGGASADVVAAALEVVNSDPDVRAILVNIFGGITRGEEVANGIVAALARVDVRSPIVVRLDGTNAEEGRRILADQSSGNLFSEPTMMAAAKRAVELATAARPQGAP